MYKLIDNLDITLNAEDVLKGQGIDPNRASKRLFNDAEAIIEEAYSLVNPVALYTVVKVSAFEHQKISFEGGYFEGPLVAKAMAGAESLNIAMYSIGPELENRVNELMKENPVKAVALDGAGIAALRKVSQAIEGVISAEACEQGLDLGMRAQPGQEGWPIEQQREVFSLLPAEKINLRLTESCMIIPRKSATFVIPRGKNLDSSMIPCDFCSKQDRCEWRKEKQTG
ncbi:MAG: hypothetical protein R6U91_07535 [Bacillota bacterium]